jgi:hypothetical protein
MTDLNDPRVEKIMTGYLITVFKTFVEVSPTKIFVVKNKKNDHNCDELTTINIATKRNIQL